MRFQHAAANSASQETLLRYRHLVDLGVTSSTLYACTGNEYLFTLGNTYSPVGGLGGIEPIQDEASLETRAVRLWLSAATSADMYEPMREDMFNRPVTIRHGYLVANTPTFVSTPETLWVGRVDKVDVRFDGGERGAHFEVTAVTNLRRRAEVVNFTNEALQTTMGQSGDTFFSYVHQVPVVKALWGNEPTAFNGVPAGSWRYGGARRLPVRNNYWTPGG